MKILKFIFNFVFLIFQIILVLTIPVLCGIIIRVIDWIIKILKGKFNGKIQMGKR